MSSRLFSLRRSHPNQVARQSSSIGSQPCALDDALRTSRDAHYLRSILRALTRLEAMEAFYVVRQSMRHAREFVYMNRTNRMAFAEPCTTSTSARVHPLALIEHSLRCSTHCQTKRLTNNLTGLRLCCLCAFCVRCACPFVVGIPSHACECEFRRIPLATTNKVLIVPIRA
jgi:hypothetical protein